MIAATSAPAGRPGRPSYARLPSLVLINGLAEQAESWYCNRDAWSCRFDVFQPNLLAYDGACLHRRIASGGAIDIEFLVAALFDYLDAYVQAPPYHLVANSLGGKIAVEFAVRHPVLVDRLVLLCPSGLSDDERLPIVEGVRRGDASSLVTSVFYNPLCADPGLIEYYQRQLGSRRWKTGLLRTVRGTHEHRVRDLLPRVTRPTLLVVGEEDRIVDPRQAIDAAALLPDGQLVVLPRCGHAPQIECADQVNHLVAQFLTRAADREASSCRP